MSAHRRSRRSGRDQRRPSLPPVGAAPGQSHGGATPGVVARPERLQKVLAAAGLGSRRECEELILAGRVEVDRKVVTELGTRVDRARQEIRVDGAPLRRPRWVYYAVNKPPGVVSTRRDPAGRPRVTDLVPEHRERLFPVGRLDLGSEGLMLLTNDGELANRLTHPRYGVPKTYRVQVAGVPDRDVLVELRRGVRLAEGRVHAEFARLKSRHKKSAILEIVLREGRNREIRRMLARLGHKVIRLARIAVGPIRLGDLPRGGYRALEPDELDQLRRAAFGAAERPVGQRRPPEAPTRGRRKRQGPQGPPAQQAKLPRRAKRPAVPRAPKDRPPRSRHRA